MQQYDVERNRGLFRDCQSSAAPTALATASHEYPRFDAPPPQTERRRSCPWIRLRCLARSCFSIGAMARVSLAEIAAAVGVSKNTVSRALRGDPRISAPTRLRVERAAEQMGYRRDPVLAALGAARWRRREGDRGAAIVSLMDLGHRYLPYFVAEDLFRSAAATCRRLGYSHELFNAKDYPSPRRLQQVLEARGVAGLLVHYFERDSWFDAIEWSHFPAVVVGLGRQLGPLHAVVADLSWSMEQLARRLHVAGVRRVHIVWCDEMRALFGLHRAPLAYLLEAGRRHGRLKVEEVLMQPMLGTEPAPEFSTWFRRTRPECILGFSNSVYWWLKTLGCRMPEDVRYASLLLNQLDTDAALIAGGDGRMAEQGAVAAETLDSLIRSFRTSDPTGRLTVLLEAHWHEGRTLGLTSPAEPASTAHSAAPLPAPL
jgi:LacI family transcriptional regulator